MSGGDDESTEKELAPSQKKLDDARLRGEIARSPDLVTAGSYAGLLLASLTGGAYALRQAGAAAATLLGDADRLASGMMDNGSAALGGILSAFVPPLLPLFLVPAAGALGVILATRTLVFTPGNLAPKLSRISPLAMARQKFGLDGLFEFGKSTAKLLIVGVVLGLFLRARADEILTTLHLEPGLAVALLLRLVTAFLTLILLVSGVIGGLDYLWQRASHVRRNRMSRKDMLDEHKDSDGDPHMKAQRRMRGQEIATNRMLRDVATADVIVVNPTHYAVALKWARGSRAAPVCVAKGVDEIAARIRERAAEHGVPIHSDPPTARAVFASVDVGQEIGAEHYRAIAAAIRFAERMRARARARARGQA